MNKRSSFFRVSSSKNKILTVEQLKKFESYEHGIDELEKICKKLLFDLKSSQNAMVGMGKCDLREVALSLPCVEGLGTIAEELDGLSRCTEEQLEITTIVPLKSWNSALANLQTMLKKWDNQLQDCSKLQQKIEKMESKEKTAQAALKISEARTSLEQARVQFDHLHNELQLDMPYLIENRCKFAHPVFEALISVQLSFLDAALKAYSSNCDAIIHPDREQHDNLVRDKLSQIKKLSITVDD